MNNFLFGFLFLLILIPVFGFSFKLMPLEFLGLFYLGVFPTAIAFLIWNNALKSTETYICSNIALLTPFLSLILIFIFLKEKIYFYHLLGFIIIISSVFLNLKYGKKQD